MRRFYLLHPFLFALSPAVFLWSQNFSEVFIWEALVTVSVLLVFGGLIFGAFRFLYRDISKAAIVASVSIVLTVFYQYIFFSPLTFHFMRHRWALLLSLSTVIAVIYAVRKAKSDLSTLNKVLAVVSGTFVLLSLMQIAGNSYSSLTHKAPVKFAVTATEPIQKPRDIYYIILDEYTSPDVLKNVLGFSDDHLVDFLKKNGFYLPEKSRSNYPTTYLSLPSSLNMRYVNEYLDESTASRNTLTEITQDHFLKDFLKSYGYRYIHFGAPWVDHFNPYADENINIDTFSPYQAMVWDVSAFVPIAMTLSGHGPVGEKLVFLHLDSFDFRLTHWKRIQFQLQELAKIPDRKEGPVFVFAHLLIPHDPFVFDADGNFLTKEKLDSRSQKENYLAQVAYISKEVEKLVVKLQKSDPKPIIIIQGDHGHKFPTPNPELLKKEYGLEPKQAANLMTRNLNAYYLPDGGNQLLYNTITPVNSFRIVFDKYFGQKFGLLEDKSYSYGPPYDPAQSLELVN
ncbi:MAG: sulfatase-like hydrolase/transferase [bacterium]|nr:sulfatase-like hydrolase/transferase [bacterium]